MTVEGPLKYAWELPTGKKSTVSGGSFLLVFKEHVSLTSAEIDWIVCIFNGSVTLVIFISLYPHNEPH